MADHTSAFVDGNSNGANNVHFLTGVELDKLFPAVLLRVEELTQIQSQHDELKAKFLEERAALEAKYEEMYQPFYSKRYDIVNGIVEAERVIEIGKDRDTEIGVPYFWLTAMKKIGILSQELSVCDEGALKYLKDIKYKKLDKEKGFKLEFLFDTNHYFKNTVLTKTYYLRDEKEAILDKAIGTEIEWYPGECLTKKILKERPKEGCQDAVPYTKTEVCASFLNFFDPPKPPRLNANIDQDIVKEFQTLMGNDYKIGLTIAEKLIPNAVSWFLWMDEKNGDSYNDYYSDVEDIDFNFIKKLMTMRKRKMLRTKTKPR